MKQIKRTAFIVGALALGAFGNIVMAAEDYKKQAGVSGNITSVGSDTLANLMTLWSQEFKRLYPHVKIQIQASGSSTAPPALTEGTANIGPMSRELKSSEINYFSREHGYAPVALQVAVDAIALFVERRNPIEGLTLAQVDAIFSVTRYCGAPEPISTWSQLGFQLPQTDSYIKLFGRNSVSGTYGLFKREALCEGDFRATVNEQPGSASVVQSVAYSRGAIGYAAFGHKTAGVRALSIADSEGNFVPVTVDTVASGQYPFSRSLYLVINKSPDSSLPLLEREFLRFVLSRQGQDLVRRDGYIAIPQHTLKRQLELIMQ